MTTSNNLTLEQILALDEDIDEAMAVGGGMIVGGPMTMLGDDKEGYFPNGGEDRVGNAKTASPALHEFVDESLQEGYLDDLDLKTYKNMPRSGSQFDQLGLLAQKSRKRRRLKRAGIENITKVYNEASDWEKDYWGKWYKHANEDVQKLALRHRVPLNIVAALIAIMSPSATWSSNLVAADRVLTGYGTPHGIPAMPVNSQKAIDLLKDPDRANRIFDFVTGPKVTTFYKSLVNPEEIREDIVLDGHAINIWRGVNESIKGLELSDVMRKRIMEDYLTAAKELGVTTSALQSVTWYVWRAVIRKKPYAVPKNPFSLSAKGFKVDNDNDGIAGGQTRKRNKESTPQLSLPFGPAGFKRDGTLSAQQPPVAASSTTAPQQQAMGEGYQHSSGTLANNIGMLRASGTLPRKRAKEVSLASLLGDSL